MTFSVRGDVTLPLRFGVYFCGGYDLKSHEG